MSVRPLLAIGFASAGIGAAIAISAAPQVAAAPTNSGTPSATSTNHQPSSTQGKHLARKSAVAKPYGGFTTKTASSTTTAWSSRGTAPTSHAFVASSGGETGAVKHHWGTHHGHHGLL